MAGADIVADLGSIDYDAPEVRAAFEQAEGLRPVQHRARRAAIVRLGAAADALAAHEVNAHRHSKRVFEAMAEMYNMTPDRWAVALRFGWMPQSIDEARRQAAGSAPTTGTTSA